MKFLKSLYKVSTYSSFVSTKDESFTLKAKYVPYLLGGFLFATFIDMPNILPVAIMGLAFALLEYYLPYLRF